MQDLAQRLYDEGRFDEAAGACRDRLMRDPRDLNAMHLLGLVHLRRQEAADAVPLLFAVAATRPDSGVMNDLGSALAVVGRADEAIARFQSALAMQPDCLPALANLGKALLEHGRTVEAIPLLRQALALGPDFALRRVQLANALLEHGNRCLADDKPREAEYCYREAMELRAEFSEAAANLGTALVAQNRLPEAVEVYRTALRWRPGYANTEFSLSLALLLDGAFAEGWRCFEARRDMPAKATTYQRRLDIPQCRPQDLLSLSAGHTVLLLAEQGLGDMIQYARYVPLLMARGVQVILESQPELHALFRCMQGVTLIAPNDPSPDCDAACFLLSLPLAFATDLATIPGSVPYLNAAPDRRAHCGTWLGSAQGRRIGFVVSGDPSHPHDRSRSIPLTRLAPLFTVPTCTFVLAQRDVGEVDRAVIASSPNLRAPLGALQDFADTAALLSHCDLLITVDTSVAHLAGALGVPVWLMLRFSPDYRWLLGRSDSPWYPTMRLYRQPSPGDWDAVIEAVRRDLSDLR